WSISSETPFEFDEMRADYPYLCKIDDAHYLCSYEGPGHDGWAVVLNVELPGVGIADDEIISNIFKLSNFPNPFNPFTTIQYSIPRESKVELKIYNIRGQKVKTLVHSDLVEGNHNTLWDGRDYNQQPVGSGIYFYKLKVNGKLEAVKKCLLLK
ncbi:MAG: T9SS type A sorting domain-containing protein, partial [Candidatus Cloacimonetes bacterium]|nr:T9SS type A sorting domain-containing protein [Candidatus Cloacimonadota bacterium]